MMPPEIVCANIGEVEHLDDYRYLHEAYHPASGKPKREGDPVTGVPRVWFPDFDSYKIIP